MHRLFDDCGLLRNQSVHPADHLRFMRDARRITRLPIRQNDARLFRLTAKRKSITSLDQRRRTSTEIADCTTIPVSSSTSSAEVSIDTFASRQPCVSEMLSG